MSRRSGHYVRHDGWARYNTYQAPLGQERGSSPSRAAWQRGIEVVETPGV